ncbi:MAG: hypothetical protein AUI14_07175 [Actinobacteria bacterium 13_2_20CM_2_71_6]|nr:MAG: hypothetical protein AUI14_07175 [Actinobacteria bacterium 13_2_20CM_2_71_6]
MTFVGRRDVADDEPAYVFRSPCCGVTEVVPAWAARNAIAAAGGRIRLHCGRSGADPLRPAGTGKTGCGKPFEVDGTALR